MTDQELFTTAISIIQELLHDCEFEDCAWCLETLPNHSVDCRFNCGMEKLKNRRDELYRESIK